MHLSMVFLKSLVHCLINFTPEAFGKVPLKRAVEEGASIHTPSKDGCKEEPAEAG